jgi:hypothetical protein
MSSVGTGTKAVLNLATGAAGAASGLYFDGLRESRAHVGTYDPAVRARLREVTAELLA